MFKLQIVPTAKNISRREHVVERTIRFLIKLYGGSNCTVDQAVGI